MTPTPTDGLLIVGLVVVGFPILALVATLTARRRLARRPPKDPVRPPTDR